jgi:hypothetical protein
VTGAVNQQERPGFEQWVVGFVDGEGCFFQQFFGCGRVGVNRRHDNHRHDMWRWSVRSLVDLTERIIPFFEENPLRTAKAREFEKFSTVVRMMGERRHLTVEGLSCIAGVAETMNFQRPSRFLESSEAIRQPPRSTPR